jgi:polyisoprenoid-binding protein YceI
MAVQITQAAQSTARAPQQGVPASRRWRVDSAHSSVTFSARGFWGSVAVTGSFAGPVGAATVHQDGRISGELVIAAATLSTGLALRDRHLRGRDFFDVERYPEIRFAPDRLIVAGGRIMVCGELAVRDRIAELELPVELAEEPGGRLALTAHAVLDREPLGLGHSPLGMIRGPADVGIDLVLTPDESPNSGDDRSPSRHADSARSAQVHSNGS